MRPHDLLPAIDCLPQSAPTSVPLRLTGKRKTSLLNTALKIRNSLAGVARVNTEVFAAKHPSRELLQIEVVVLEDPSAGESAAVS